MPNNQIKPKTPVIFLAFANERTEGGFLRNLTKELKMILRALEPAVQKGRCQLRLIPAATQEEISSIFQDEWYEGRICIFHYGGHADEDELWLEKDAGGNQSFFSAGLARFLGAQQGLKLVFLNGCATYQHAQLLLDAKLPAVIGTSRKILDDQALLFATTFYQGLASGASVEQAYGEAEGILLGQVGPKALSEEYSTRSLELEDESEGMEAGPANFPWRLYLQKEADWFPANWRLFHELKEPAEAGFLEAVAFVGQTINNYRIDELLGQGSMGSVFRATHIGLNEERAIKITHRVLEGYDYLKRILIAGHKGLEAINHPNVAASYDVGEVILFGEKRLYMVMELVKGERLDKIDPTHFLGSKEKFGKLRDMAMLVCAGVEAAHKTQFIDETGRKQEGIVHGNIKTRKILFTPEGVPKLIDFLFTDLSRSRSIKLDLPPDIEAERARNDLESYFAPELIRGETGANKQTDIYSLGAVFFEFVAGKSLADLSFNSVESLHKFVKNETRKENIYFPKFLSEVIFLAIKPNARERYQEVSQMIEGMLGNTSFWKRILFRFKRK